MSTRLSTTHQPGLIAHRILGGSIPALPQPVTCDHQAEKVRRRRKRRVSPMDRPWCAGCHEPLLKKGTSKVTGAIQYRCLPCDYAVMSSVVGGYAERRYPVNSRPHCVGCRHHFSMKLAGWFCKRCDVTIPTCELPAPVTTSPDRNPSCVLCRALMFSKSPKAWKCYDCGVSVHKIGKRPPKPKDLPRPACLTCRNSLSCSGKNVWHCSTCNYSIKTHYTGKFYKRYRRPVDGDEMLAFCNQLVPRTWSNRDDVIQELLMLMLSRKLTRADITPLKVRQINRALLKRQSHYLDISFETPTRGSNTLGMMLAECRVG